MTDPEAIPAVPSAAERLPSLDLIRGVAILGVLTANIPWFLGPTGDAIGQHPAPASFTDAAIAFGTLLLIDGKFITLLSILFGVGLAIQSDRADALGRPFVGYYLRRQGWLFLIGLAHGLLLWFGDILASYAVAGMGALALRRFSQRGLVFWIMGLLTWVATVGVLFIVMSVLTGEAEPAVHVLPADARQPLTLADIASEADFMAYGSPENQVRTYRHGAFAQMVAMRVMMLAFFWTFWLWTGWNILACFLIGVYLWRSGLFANGAAARRLARIGLSVSLPILLGLSVWRGVDPDSMGPELLAILVALPQSLAYLGLLLLWSDSGCWSGLQGRLRAVGRMALTNYLMQSLLLGLIFYGYGLNLFDQLDRLAGLGIVMAIAALQLTLSPIWLRYFRLGPVEWLWRSLADWQWRPMRAVPQYASN